MIEFEPTYVQEFNLYLGLRGLLAYSICGVDLHFKGGRSENSILIRSAITMLEKFLDDPDSDEFSMLARVKEEVDGPSGNLRGDLLNFLRRVLSILKDERRPQESEYIEVYNSLKTLLDKLIQMNRHVEEKVLARYSCRKPYQI